MHGGALCFKRPEHFWPKMRFAQLFYLTLQGRPIWKVIWVKKKSLSAVLISTEIRKRHTMMAIVISDLRSKNHVYGLSPCMRLPPPPPYLNVSVPIARLPQRCNAWGASSWTFFSSRRRCVVVAHNSGVNTCLVPRSNLGNQYRCHFRESELKNVSTP